MANQPNPPRPWFRFGSIARVAPASAPAPTPPVPQPRLPLLRSAVGPSSQPEPYPSQPALTKTEKTSSPLVTASQAQKSAPTVTNMTVAAATNASPAPPPKTIKEPAAPAQIIPPQSPKLKSQAKQDEPKSPAESEKKQKKEPPEKGKHETETKEKLSDFIKKFSLNSEKLAGGASVLTLAGDNQGAVMRLTQSPRSRGLFEGSPHHKKGSIGEGDDQKKMKEKIEKAITLKGVPKYLYANSNVQGINNSLLYDSSSSYHDPGVHLLVLRKPAGGGLHGKERISGYSN